MVYYQAKNYPDPLWLRLKILLSILKYSASGSFVLGKNVSKFESKIKQFLGLRFAVGLGSGTDAIYHALSALGIKGGDEVITTPFSCVASAQAIVLTGARPVFVDIDPLTYNIDPEKIPSAVTPRTKAIMPVHLFGQSCDMQKILNIASRHGLFVVEDAAQALGAFHNNRAVGTFGEAACFSFFQDKNLGTWGDGGLVATNNEDIYSKLLAARLHGARSIEDFYISHGELMPKSRLQEIQACVLNVKFPYLEEWNKRRIYITGLYRNYLNQIGDLKLPYVDPKNTHVYSHYIVRTKLRDKLFEFLRSRGFNVGVHYPAPLHLLDSFSYLNHKIGSFLNAEVAAKEVISLPTNSYLPDSEVRKISYAIKQFYGD